MNDLQLLKKLVQRLGDLDKNEFLYGSVQIGRFYGNNGVSIGIPRTNQPYKAIPEKVTADELIVYLKDHIEGLEDFDRRVKESFDKVLVEKYSRDHDFEP